MKPDPPDPWPWEALGEEQIAAISQQADLSLADALVLQNASRAGTIVRTELSWSGRYVEVVLRVEEPKQNTDLVDALSNIGWGDDFSYMPYEGFGGWLQFKKRFRKRAK